MAIPAQVTGGGGATSATKCFKATFSTALSSAPKLEGWDNTQTFPARDASGATASKEIFTGTADNLWYPCLAAWSGGAESSGNLPGANWHPDSPTAGSANPNLLMGLTNFVTCTNTPGVGGDIVFNLSLLIADDMSTPSASSMAHILQIKYTYTGTAPVITFAFNEGTEGTPSWTAMVPGTDGHRFCNSGTAPSTYVLTMPGSGEETVAAEIWVTT